MSSMEYWKGIIRQVASEKEMEKYAKKICDEKGYKKGYKGQDFVEVLQDSESGWIVTNDGLYINEAEEVGEFGLNTVKEIEPGVYSIILTFYNGGTYLDEMFEEYKNSD